MTDCKDQARSCVALLYRQDRRKIGRIDGLVFPRLPCFPQPFGSIFDPVLVEGVRCTLELDAAKRNPLVD